MSGQVEKRYDPTEPLQKIDEETDNIWLDEVVEPTINPSFHQSANVDEHSPLERLVQSISSDDQWTVDDESDVPPKKHLYVKTYYDPTRPTEDRWNEEDSEDEVTTLPPKKENDSLEGGAMISSIVLFRYLFGKTETVGNGQFQRQRTSSENEQNEARNQVLENAKEDEKRGNSQTDQVAKEHETNQVAQKELAENLPILLLEKLRKVFTNRSSDDGKKLGLCPLCGQDTTNILYSDFRDRLKTAKLWRIVWVDPNADLESKDAQVIYKTELHIDEDGNQSLSESFYRNPAERKRMRVEV